MTNQIYHTIVDGPSPLGISTIKGWLNCAMKASLSKVAKENPDVNYIGTLATLTGTIYHAYQEIYREKNIQTLDTTVIEFSHTSGLDSDLFERARQDAEKLFRAYRVKYKPNDLGKVLGKELVLGVDDNERDKITNAEWSCGLPLTGKLDLVTEVSAATARGLKKNREIDVRPGVYVTDFKTDRGEFGMAGTMKKYRYDIQFPFYMLLLKELRPEWNVQGALVDIVLKPYAARKNPDFGTLVIPPLSGEDVEIIKQQLRIAKERMDMELPPHNTEYCTQWEGCGYLNNPCKRYHG